MLAVGLQEKSLDLAVEAFSCEELSMLIAEVK